MALDQATIAGIAAQLLDAERTATPIGQLSAEHRVTLEAGQLVIPGAVHGAVPANAGDTFTATFDRLGSVTVRFT